MPSISKYFDVSSPAGGLDASAGYFMIPLSKVVQGAGPTQREGNKIQPFLLEITRELIPYNQTDSIAVAQNAWTTSTGAKGICVRTDLLKFENSYNANDDELANRYLSYDDVTPWGSLADTLFVTTAQEHSQSTTASQIKVIRSDKDMTTSMPIGEYTDSGGDGYLLTSDAINGANYYNFDNNLLTYKVDLRGAPPIEFDVLDFEDAPSVIKNGYWLLIYSDQSEAGSGGGNFGINLYTRLHYNDC